MMNMGDQLLVTTITLHALQALAAEDGPFLNSSPCFDNTVAIAGKLDNLMAIPIGQENSIEVDNKT